MNHTLNLHLLVSRARPAGIALGVLAAVTAWFGGCADPRSQPLQPSAPGYTETIVLWDNAASNGTTIEATFNVAQELAPIENPTLDTPARLTIVGYIRPDSTILRREVIVGHSIPALSDQIIALLIILEPRERASRHLVFLDSLCAAQPDTCDSLHMDNVVLNSLVTWLRAAGDTVGNDAYDRLVEIQTLCADTAYPDTCAKLYVAPAVVDSLIYWVQNDTAAYHDTLNGFVADTTALGAERDSLGRVADNRYVLSLWLDAPDTSAATIPEAVYQLDGTIAHQSLYLAATDTATGYKGRGFNLRLNNFMAANPDPEYLGEMREVNWTTCFPGSTRPCLRSGEHVLRARVSGADTKITGTLVLVYEGRTTP